MQHSPDPNTSMSERNTGRRNFILHLTNGIIIFVSEAFTDPNLVVTAFLSQLTASNVLIGLLAPLRNTGWYLPQLFISPWVERLPLKVKFYAGAAYFRVAGWALLCLAMFTFTQPAALLASFFACMLIISLSGGFAGLPYMTVTQKVIPANRMGLLFGLGLFIGGGLAVLASGSIGVLLAGNFLNLHLSFPQNYAVLFAISTVFLAIACAAFSLIRETPDVVPARATPMAEQFRRARQVFQTDARFRSFFLLRVALMFGMTSIPFVTVFAKRALNSSDAYLGSLVPFALAASLLSNLVWARINDRRSSRAVLALCTGLGVVLCALVLLMSLSPAMAFVILPAAYAIGGAINSGTGVAMTPQVMEVVPPGQAPLYFGLLNSLLGVVMLFTSLVGLIADQLGYAALFVFCGACFVLAFERVLRLRRPVLPAGVASH